MSLAGREQPQLQSVSAVHYSRMAKYYDKIYGQIVDYRSQASYVQDIIRRFHRRKVKSILDVACGTGNYTFVFAERGYDVTGFDMSKAMIEIALSKLGKRDNPKFFMMDMRRMHLEENYDSALVLFGGFGYLTKYTEVQSFLRSVREVLRPRGILVFEFWNRTAIREEAFTTLGYKSYDITRDGTVRIIRLHTGRYSKRIDGLELKFDCYAIDSRKRRLLDSFSEIHRIRTYHLSEMKNILSSSGFETLAILSGGTGKMSKLEHAGRNTFRVMVVAKPRK